ncbi:MAG: hypothetical protein ACOH10_07970 [Rhodoglobus sp.]
MNEYTILIGGLPHTVLLDEAEATRIGAKPVAAKSAPTPANKARTARNKSHGR